MGISKRRGYVILNHQVYPAEEVIDAINDQGVAEFNFEGHILVIGKRRIFPIRFSNLEDIMKLTCYGSLAYCCSPEFECSIRDEVLRLLGLTKEDYARLKAQHHVEFIKLAREKSSYSFESYPSARINKDEPIDQPLFPSSNESFVDEQDNLSALFNKSFPTIASSVQSRSNSDYNNVTRSTSAFIKCPNCGALVSRGATFCNKCGYPLRKPL